MRETSFNVLAVGFFDGVHLGHQAILRGADAALTFRSHPLLVVAPDRVPQMIMSVDERVSAIRECGVRKVVLLDFSSRIASMKPEDFLLMARARTGFTSIRCGANWRFGRDGSGTAEWLMKRGESVEVVPYAEFHGAPVSSSRIRECLRKGAIEDAAAMLGRPVSTPVMRFHGKGMGSGLGFPTVNFEIGSPIAGMLPLGVYKVECGHVPGIANFGVAPTMGGRAWTKPVLEVYFPSGEVPSERDGETVSFISFIRPEKRFESFDALKAQIARDCEMI